MNREGVFWIGYEKTSFAKTMKFTVFLDKLVFHKEH